MKILFDASSAINLVNGQVLTIVLQLPGYTFHIGPQALGECGDRHPEIEDAVDNNRILLADDSDVPANRFLELLEEFELGVGETECLALCEHDDGFVICCDDKRARIISTEKFGSARLTGSIGILKVCVAEGLLTAIAARQAVETMRSRGAFLPELSEDFFD